MAEFPAFPLWTDAYLGDTGHLTAIEHGAYLLLLISMWRAKDKRLPNDDKMLARYAKLTAGQWARIKPVLWPFFDVADGFITQGRLTDEAEAVRQHSSRQSDKAKARWLKNKGCADAPAMPDACRNDASLTLPNIEKSSVSKDTGGRPPESFPDNPYEATDADLYGYGKAVLGRASGGVITQLRKRRGSVHRAYGTLQEAAEKESPMEWVQAILKRDPAEERLATWGIGDARPVSPF